LGDRALTVQIRQASVADATDIHRIYAPIVGETAISFEETPPAIAEIEKRIALTLPNYPYFVAVMDGKVSGYVYASQHAARTAYRYSVNTAVYVAPEARRTGVGRALYSILLSELTRRGFHAAFAGIALPNLASVALHESLGFEPLGVYREVGFKFGRWHDVGWWQRLL
jgi:L-amino acid N-acyltransferase YncA